ncbi:MAG: nucleotide exchange factor GrpE [Lachnospiraceae bacterium]|nr:nucleotide exchange factor GrpE [Lachnospiraceae bacterium]
MAIDIKDEFDQKVAETLQEEMEENEIQPDADTVETQDGEDPIAGEEKEEEAAPEEEPEEDGKTAKKAKKSRFKADKKQDALNEKINELEDKVKRQMAEFDNFRKRTDKEKNAMFETGAKSVIEKILPVVDNFERGLASIPEEEKGSPFAEGMEMIYKQLIGELEKMEVKPIPAVGEEFDPNLHNAVMQVESDEYESGVIAQELQKGYTYRGSVVRHSMVAVVP